MGAEKGKGSLKPWSFGRGFSYMLLLSNTALAPTNPSPLYINIPREHSYLLSPKSVRSPLYWQQMATSQIHRYAAALSLTLLLLSLTAAASSSNLLLFPSQPPPPSSYTSIVTASSLIIIILAFSPLLLLLRRRNGSGSNSNSNTPPGPISFPIFGNWLQVGNDLNHRYLAQLSRTHGPVFLLKLGSRNLVVVSDPKLATQVLHTQGVEFGSRPRNVVFDVFTGNGQDMVFTVYGDHWRKMRRIMTLPFFTSRVVNQYSPMWEQEMDLVVKDLFGDPAQAEKGMVIRKRLQLMLYNIMYRMMFDARFESQSDPLFQQATEFNSERSRLAQSFDYNYGDFIPILRPFLRGYLNKCRNLQSRRLAFFNGYYVEQRRYIIHQY